MFGNKSRWRGAMVKFGGNTKGGSGMAQKLDGETEHIHDRLNRQRCSAFGPIR